LEVYKKLSRFMKKLSVKKASTLEQNIQKNLDIIREIEDTIPGVLIIHDLRDSTVVYMSSRGLNTLDVTLKELIEMGQDYHSRFFNPEDAKDYVPKIMGLLERNNDDEFISCFQQVRASPQHDWAWYLTSTKIFFRDNDGKPLLLLSIAIPVDAQHHIAAKAQRLLEENNFLRNNFHVFDQLTQREKEILRMMAMGLSSIQMAKKLHISEMTASTHRRNVKNKLNVQNNYDITRFAQAFDLI
jgi:DNA-binding CsgD family transcriptional regulator